MKKVMMGAMCAAALVGCTKENKAVLETSGLDYTNLDETVRPGDDFTKFATGNWIKNNPQPDIFPRWGSFTKLGDDNTKQLAELIKGIAAKESYNSHEEQMIGDLYKLAMDSTTLNAQGAAPLMPYLEKVRAIKTREELFKLMMEEHDNMFFALYNGADDKNAKQNVMNLFQSGLSLGQRDYYLNDDANTKKVMDAFKEHFVNLEVLCGIPEAQAKKNLATLLKYETELAKAHKTNMELRNPEANYNKMTVAEFSKMSGFDWDAWLKGNTYTETNDFIVGQPVAIAKGCEILMKAPVEDLKVMYEWRWISGASSLLGDAFTNENFAYNQKLTGAKEQEPRWRRAVNLVNGTLDEPVGKMFVEKYFPGESKSRMLSLVSDLQAALGETIKAQEWMSDSTKQVALEKLATFYVKVGYPDKWEDLSGLSIDPSKSLYENMRAVGEWSWNLSKKKRYNTPVDKDEWHMSPQTVNAYYNPTTNEICFPAGILQPPFFSNNFDDAVNYGAIGVVIGHEMTHGFDDQGRQYDKDGNLRQWWSEEDVKAFDVPAQKMVEYFNGLWVIPGELKANGELSLGENLADHGGLNVAFRALEMAREKGSKTCLETENGYTWQQRFFLAYANVWAGVCSEELLRRYTLMDVHSAGHLRINGGVAQCDHWYDAFNIQPGDSLYVAPEDRVKIW
ncbi:MAG: M13 family metallopeptidase [Bacteroidales bacterium]|nr:M13 family metallopeptidase [Bacteroidales bacterium]